MSIPAPSLQDFLTPTVSFKRWDHAGDPCADLCQAALESKLYSRGTDFTAWYINAGGEPGSSYMKRFWDRSLREDEQDRHQGGSIWILEENGAMVGAVILERCVGDALVISDREVHGRWASARANKSFQAQAVGRVAMWLDPSLRGRGLMKLLSQVEVAPLLGKHAAQLRDEGFFPFVRASDASARILEQTSTLPVPGFFRRCLNEKAHLQSCMMRMGTQMHDHDEWAVAWVPNDLAPKKKTGCRP